ncbi:MAG: glycerophosphodiester phosphodiesterase [Reyranella sp.]|uniref:glycerophosphodiester phosphodiesterase n=1 Tax=Reyranella sp. TaxID=1929291 RepID=UPI001AC98B7D|nr:glycerophosphodiester phosphodiesterase [Reyranella sp.]MBN9087328.1 glycerophosphodiester phosphodiesterase [Reyranella sp.]
MVAAAFDLQAHRGGRGLAPENTLAAFRQAIALGVTTLELDLAITQDDVVVVSHEPRLNPDLARLDGQWLQGIGPTIRSLPLAELKRYDIGRLNPASAYGRQFPLQRPADGERFPTLAEVYAIAPAPMRFNIETKIDPTRPGNTVDPVTFVRLAVEQVKAAKAADRTMIQSFDWRTLHEVRKMAPKIATACLTIETANSNTIRRNDAVPSPWLGGLDLKAHGGSVPRLARAAGCAVWSPFWRNLTPETLAESHKLGLKVIPWTVNEPADMARLIDRKVDGLITDYPEQGLAILAEKGLKTR